MVAETTQQHIKDQYPMMYAGEPVRVVSQADDREPRKARGELCKALAAAQAELNNPDKKKRAKAGSYTYMYADIADVLNEVRPKLAKHGLSVVQTTAIRDGLLILQTSIMHEGGEEYKSGDFPVCSATAQPQDIGSALTYARRYALCAAVGVAAEEDKDGATVDQQQAAQTRSSPKRAEGQRKASPAGKTPDVKLDPAKPEAFPPASDSGPDLKAWGTVFANTVKVAPTLDALDAWFSRNEATLDALQEVGPKLRDRLATIHSERAEILSQAEKEAAE